MEGHAIQLVRIRVVDGANCIGITRLRTYDDLSLSRPVVGQRTTPVARALCTLVMHRGMGRLQMKLVQQYTCGTAGIKLFVGSDSRHKPRSCATASTSSGTSGFIRKSAAPACKALLTRLALLLFPATPITTIAV